ncbi:MAG: hypothetical protein HYU68_12780 [Bacteroidetes bacterium]|nr:hypothetical protein [Bacteroidota bacterium]
MNKNKLIALLIIAVIILLPFRSAFINFSVETQLLQALSMAVTIIGACIAILLYNKGAEQSNHH